MLLFPFMQDLSDLTSSYLSSWLFPFPFLYSSSPLSSCFCSVLKLVHVFLFCYILVYLSGPFVFKLSSSSYIILINLVSPSVVLKISSLLLLVYWCPEIYIIFSFKWFILIFIFAYVTSYISWQMKREEPWWFAQQAFLTSGKVK
jgi:hypothetical protein